VTISTDPAAAERSKQRLVPGAGAGDGGEARAMTHGAYSEARTRPLAEEHRRRLRALYPADVASDDLLAIVSKREALIDLFGAWVADRGPVRGRTGRVEPAARELRLLLDSQERAMAALEQRRREGAATPAGALQRHLAEHYGGEKGEGGDG
jgi:hypothetical protein